MKYPGEPKIERKLHIGGEVRAEGWEVLNAVPGEHVDHLGDAKDLSKFPDNTFTSIYASHIAEHLDYKDELEATLGEWHRVLAAEGKLYISVPDMDMLCRLFLDKKNFNAEGRFWVMRMLFGGHQDEYDYHMVGLNQEFLASFLFNAGFVNLHRTKSFGIFDDSSNLEFEGIPVSLNIIAEKAERK